MRASKGLREPQRTLEGLSRGRKAFREENKTDGRANMF